MNGDFLVRGRPDGSPWLEPVTPAALKLTQDRFPTDFRAAVAVVTSAGLRIAAGAGPEPGKAPPLRATVLARPAYEILVTGEEFKLIGLALMGRLEAKHRLTALALQARLLRLAVKDLRTHQRNLDGALDRAEHAVQDGGTDDGSEGTRAGTEPVRGQEDDDGATR